MKWKVLHTILTPGVWQEFADVDIVLADVEILFADVEFVFADVDFLFADVEILFADVDFLFADVDAFRLRTAHACVVPISCVSGYG